MKRVRLVWEGEVVRRIRWVRRVEGSGGSGGANVSGDRVGLAAAAGDEEALREGAVSVEQNDVASVEAFVFDVTAPSFGQNVTLATVPIRVTEAPTLPGLVLETQQQPLRRRRVEREVLLRVLFRNHEPVQLPDVARRQRLLEHGYLLLLLRQVISSLVRNDNVVFLLLLLVVQIETRGVGITQPHGGLLLLVVGPV